MIKTAPEPEENLSAMAGEDLDKSVSLMPLFPIGSVSQRRNRASNKTDYAKRTFTKKKKSEDKNYFNT